MPDHLRPCNCQHHRDDLTDAEPVQHVAVYGVYAPGVHQCSFNVYRRVRLQTAERKLRVDAALPRALKIKGLREQLPIPF